MAKRRVSLRKSKLKIKDQDIDKAIAHSKTERKQKGRNRLILLIVLAGVLGLYLLWQNLQEKEIREQVNELNPVIQVDETQPGTVDEASAMIAGMDNGNPCENHEYILAPGSSESLRFDVKLDYEVLHLEHLMKNMIEHDDVTVTPLVTQWADHGIVADLQNFDIQGITVKANAWGVQVTDLIEDMKRTEEGNNQELTSLSGFIGKTTHYEVNIINETQGIISVLGRYYPDEIKVGQLLPVDIKERLGGEMALAYHFQGKDYRMPVEQIEQEKTIYILTLDIGTNLPGDFAKTVQESKYSFLVKIKGNKDVQVDLKLSFNNQREKMFRIGGPAQRSDCFSGN